MQQSGYCMSVRLCIEIIYDCIVVEFDHDARYEQGDSCFPNMYNVLDR